MAKKILIVDDEQGMRLAMGETLRRAGYETSEIANPIQALGIFEKGDFSLVVSDIRMPEMNGIDLLARLKAIEPSTPVIMVTAYGTIEDAVETMKRGASDYILKPFSPDHLEAVVERHLAAPTAVSATSKHTIVTQNAEMQKMLAFLKKASQSDATVLIEAESGTGKELVARYIHDNSPRQNGPFIAVNCAAVPENLLESELFGYEKGAFTGAATAKPGKFELANDGTLLLDEIGEMSTLLQAKLLRVLQEKEIDKVGGTKPAEINVRVVASTNADLNKLVSEGKFREDLYYRLNVIPVQIPPLRQRRDDIPLLADFFIRKYAGSTRLSISQPALTALQRHQWPGNVRELENTIQRAVIVCAGIQESISPDDIFVPSSATAPKSMASGVTAGATVREMEQELILATLKQTDGNRTEAAKQLGISLRTLRNKLNEYRDEGIEFE
jgi:DNA-binding NtrC family response regulator